MKNKMKIAYMALLALIIWFALGLQFYISTERYLALGWSFIGSIIFILSYFTIQTNILVAVSLTAVLLKPQSAWGRFFSRISVITAVTVYIVIVGLVYTLILKGTAKLEGLFILADNLLHTISPILFVLFWLIFVTKENIKWNQILLWAIFPFSYLIYSLIRGCITGDYPYPFIDAAKIGYKHVAINSAFVLLAFVAISAAFISISRLLKKEQ